MSVKAMAARPIQVDVASVTPSEFLLIKLAQIGNNASSATILLITGKPEDAMEAMIGIDQSIHEIKDFLENKEEPENPKVN